MAAALYFLSRWVIDSLGLFHGVVDLAPAVSGSIPGGFIFAVRSVLSRIEALIMSWNCPTLVTLKATRRSGTTTAADMETGWGGGVSTLRLGWNEGAN